MGSTSINRVNVDIEYCGTCGYTLKFEEFSKHLKQQLPDVLLNGHEGRRASFEVKINGDLVHSKLLTLAFPDFQDVTDIIKDVSEGKNVRPAKQQPITDCVIS